jgi:hypothetical protein
MIEIDYYNDVSVVDVDSLIKEGIITDSNYRNLLYRRQLQVVRRGTMYRSALVSVDSIPERYRQLLRESQAAAAPSVNVVEAAVVPNAEAAAFFDGYRLGDGRGLSAEKRREYYANAVTLAAIGTLLRETEAKRHTLGTGKGLNWETLSDAVRDMDRKKCPHTLPQSGRRLRGVYDKFVKDGFVSLISRKYRNTNAAKVDDAVKESLLIELLGDPRNLDNVQILELYNRMAVSAGWQTITSGTVANFRRKYDLEVYAGRRGSPAFSNVKGMQVKRRAPEFPLYYWTLDGWDVELLYQQFENGRTTYYHRPTVVVVLDACCKYPVGYAVGTHETPELIRAALRNAALHTKELFGRMHRTGQIQSDNYSIKQMTPYYEVMGEKVTPARVRNAKAKVVEPYFHALNKQYCQMERNWSGFGITSNKESQPNVEYLNQYRKDFPDYEGVCHQVTGFMEKERAKKAAQYRELYDRMPAEHRIELKEESYLLAFGERSPGRALLQGSGLKITVGGVKRDYDCFELSFRDHASVRWEVRYDPASPGRALAVNEDETLRYLLEEKYVQPMALRERKAGDSDELQRVRAYNKELEAHVTDVRKQAAETLQEAFAGHTELETLSKLTLIDSRGQHKDRRNGSRLKAKAETIEAEMESDIYDLY